ncbi:MAG: site-2 protease family protein [Oscillospiraceae bacterium]|nr:site-2 protease family protein [Oscillospiraceae bacterium]
MLRNLLNFGKQDLIDLLYFLPIFLITITVHECAHGYIAYKMGDPTAKNMGRLTLNPLKHMDPIGFIMLMFLGFGWAKPVMIDPRNFRNPKKGMALSALAGPVSNILMAVFGALALGLINYFYFNFAGQASTFVEMARWFFNYFITLNVYFAVFNFLPVPPLDGSRIVSYFLPYRLSYYYNYIERYGFLVLIVLLYTGILSVPLQFLSGLIIGGITYVLRLAPFLLL